ncbi:MAG: hypothetical protein AAGI07_08850, partial [Bacteroidota bacterium]
LEPEFAALYEDLKWIIPGIKYASRKQLKQELISHAKTLPKFSDGNIIPSEFDLEKDFGISVKQESLYVSSKQVIEQPKTSITKYARYGIAASIALIIAFTFLFLQKTNPETAYQLAYNEIGQGSYPYLRNDDDDIELRRTPLPQMAADKVQEAYLEYQERNYSNAIKLFVEVKRMENEKDEKLIFYLGNAYLANGNAKEAIQTFKEIAEYEHSFLSRTKWYLGLSYLKNSDLDNAQLIFKDMKENVDDSYREKAIQALEEIKWGIF